MRNYEQELENRVSFIRQLLKESGCEGIVYGNSGGKDSALVGILCKKACGNTVGILLPCATTQNYGSDTDDAIRVARAVWHRLPHRGSLGNARRARRGAGKGGRRAQ